MRRKSKWLQLIGCVALTIASGRAQNLRLSSQSLLERGVPAFPRIASPSASEAKINASLATFDRLTKMRVCTGADDEGHDLFWKRTIEITLRGPALLSLLVSEAADCGGVHPFNETYPLVYDLRTGTFVDWSVLLAGTDAKFGTAKATIGIPFTTVKSVRIQALYVARYKSHGGCRIDDLVDSENLTTFSLYPQGNALQVIPVSVLRTDAACADPVELGPDALSSLGIAARWRDFLLASKAKH